MEVRHAARRFWSARRIARFIKKWTRIRDVAGVKDGFGPLGLSSGAKLKLDMAGRAEDELALAVAGRGPDVERTKAHNMKRRARRRRLGHMVDPNYSWRDRSWPAIEDGAIV